MGCIEKDTGYRIQDTGMTCENQPKPKPNKKSLLTCYIPSHTITHNTITHNHFTLFLDDRHFRHPHPQPQLDQGMHL